MARLRELQERHEQVGDVRGRGLLVAVELVWDRETKAPATDLGREVTADALQRGLSVNVARSGSTANCLRMAPPLSISEAEIDTGIEILDESLTSVLRAARSSKGLR
jgi:2,2-dialkylglycine decarboxylase (pyruvate)